MNEFGELIKRLCPDGIRYIPLGTVCKIEKGVQFNKANMSTEGAYPVINGGTKPSGYIEQYNQCEDTITISQGGASAGYVNWLTTKFWAGAHCYIVTPGTKLISRYAYHFVKSQECKLQECQYGAGIPALAQATIANLSIPVPPLAVQEEIVRILDKFTELENELEAELEKEQEARKKQYEWYRDRLLSFDNETEYLPLGTIFNVRNGYTPPKANAEFWEGGMIPWFRMEDIRKNGRYLYDALQHVTPAAVKRGALFPANSLIISTTATIGEHALLKTEGLTNQQITNCTLKPEYADKIYLQFAFYYFFKLGEWCKENANLSGGLAIIGTEKIKQFLFPVPPIEEQRRIVAILDRLDALCNDITTGLPAEIAARRKQYEYYRDKLLSFEEVA